MAQWLSPPLALGRDTFIRWLTTTCNSSTSREPQASCSPQVPTLIDRHKLTLKHIIKNKSFRKKEIKDLKGTKTVFVVYRNISAKVKVSTCSQSYTFFFGDRVSMHAAISICPGTVYTPGWPPSTGVKGMDHYNQLKNLNILRRRVSRPCVSSDVAYYKTTVYEVPLAKMLTLRQVSTTIIKRSNIVLERWLNEIAGLFLTKGPRFSSQHQYGSS